MAPLVPGLGFRFYQQQVSECPGRPGLGVTLLPSCALVPFSPSVSAGDPMPLCGHHSGCGPQEGHLIPSAAVLTSGSLVLAKLSDYIVEVL